MAANFNLLNALRESADTRRSLLLETLATKESSKRQIGQFAAYWKGFNSNGDGLVLHRGKVVTARVLGTTSIQFNGLVNLTVTEDDYFVNW